MLTLILGLALFFLLHLVPVFAVETRKNVAARVGTLPYKGLFALATLGSLFLVVRGWQTAEPTYLYATPQWAYHLAALLILIGFVLFFASRPPTNIKRFIRHPQLTGVVFWAAGHLIVNGDTRSLVLFLGFAAWALVTILGTNRRDGAWKKPDKQPLFKDIITVAIGVTLYVVFAFWAHQYLIGVNPMP